MIHGPMLQARQDATCERPTGVFSPPFIIAVTLLGSAAFLAGPGTTWLNLNAVKAALALQKPLGELDEGSLYPYRVVRRQILEDVIVEALGTDLYLKWTLEDTSVDDKNDPLRYAELFVTYYTGGSSLVPHTPDVCYLGHGYSPAQPHGNLAIDVPSLGSSLREVPIRVCTFVKTAIFGNDDTSVVYTFHCNGRFAIGPRIVRMNINTPTHRYAYFSKVEVSFPGASREQAVRGTQKLFRRVLPVLVRDHWPDFEAAEKAARDKPRTVD